MKLPWDKNYLKIAVHVIFTVVAIYVLVVAVNALVYALTNLDEIALNFSDGGKWLLSVFAVLIIAFIIAYLLDPLVDFFQERFSNLKRKRLAPLFSKITISLGKKKNKEVVAQERRTAGTILTYLTFLLIVAGFGIFLTKAIGSGIGQGYKDGNIVSAVDNWLKTTGQDLNNFYISVTTRLMEWGVVDFVSDIITGLLNRIRLALEGLSVNVVGLVTTAGNYVFNFALALVVAFYFLKDKLIIKRALSDVVDLTFPKRGRRIKSTLTEIHVVFSGYIRGQLTDAVIMTCLISTALSLIGVKFGIIIGIISGFSNLIPYFGAIVAFVLSVSVALLSSGPTQALYAGVAILILQQIDGMFIVPKVVGEKVELSPALVLLSLAVFGNLFGIVGMVFAVPTCAIIKIFLVRLYGRRKRMEAFKRE